MNQTATQRDSPASGRTLSLVREALAHGETACVTQVLEIIQEVSDRADHLSIQELADLIGRDLTTVAKIMQAANCLGYNPGAIDVTTLTEAISVIGFEKIRNLAISLLLLETAEQRSGAAESRTIAAHALSSALTAQVIIRRTTSLNSDQAFVCAALRHYGQLLLSTFLPDEYREALDLAEDMPLSAACTFVFGLTPLDLGRHILEESNLPWIIAGTLQEADADLFDSKKLSERDRLLVVSEFSTRLSELLGSPGLTSESFETGMKRLLTTYAHSVGLTEKDLKQVLGEVEQMLGTIGRAHGLDAFSNPLMNRLRAVVAGRKLEPAPVAPRPAPAEAETTPPESRGPDPIAAALVEVQRLVSVQPIDPRRVFALATRAIKAGLRLRSCLVFLQESDGPMFAATLGSGAFFEAIRNQPVLDPHRKDVFTVCLARGEDVLIQDPDDPRILPFIPDWFQRIPGKGPFLLLPVKDSGGTFAIICGTTGKTDRIELNATRLQQLKLLRNHLGAIRSSLVQSRAAA
jgi:HD-like signal output (HDOD) protein